MPSISIFLTEDPLLNVFAFKPGEKINIHVTFSGNNLPERYRLQILDHKQNSRLNRYGKGLTDIIVNNWPIPTSIRDEHLGIWYIKVDFSESFQKQQDQASSNHYSLSQYFFVEHTERIEYPLIGGKEIVEIPTSITSSEEMAIEPSPADKPVMAATIEPKIEEVAISIGSDPVTIIRGIGNVYASRLASILVYTVSDFWYYSDRIHLAEIMRISDTRVEKMLNEAEIILSENAELMKRSELEVTDEYIPDDLRTVEGISSPAISRLKGIGVTSKTDLLDFNDLELLRTTIKVTKTQFKSIMSSIGRILEPEMVKKPVKLSPEEEPVTAVKGIGSVTAKKLRTVGITTVKSLLDCSYIDIQSIATKTRYQKWIKSASLHVGMKPHDILIETGEYPSSDSLIALPGIGVKTEKKLNNIGIFSKEELKLYTDLEKLRKVLRMSEIRFNKFMNSL